MGAEVVEQSESYVIADTAPSILSFGEQITIRVEESGYGTAVTIVSCSALPTAVDYGKNKRNVRRLVAGLT